MPKSSVLEPYGNCYKCMHMRELKGDRPGNVQCVKPDPGMWGSRYAFRMGWFFYPISFSPLWRKKKCDNFEVKNVLK